MGWLDDPYSGNACSVDGILNEFTQYSSKRITDGRRAPSTRDFLAALSEAERHIPTEEKEFYKALVDECIEGMLMGKYCKADPETLREIRHNAMLQRGNA